MKSAEVYRNGKLAGFLTQFNRRRYEFRYTDEWFNDINALPVSLTLPKSQKVYEATHLFPCFYNMLSEGVNRQHQAQQLKIDEEDYFGLLLATATKDTIGAITVKPILPDNK